MKWVLSLFIFLSSSIAWAADKGDSFFTDTATSGRTDASISILEQVFGTVGNVLQGSSGEMLAHLFYRFNQGLVVIAGGWLIFVFCLIVFRSAQEGSFMSANKQVAMLCLRVAIACACLVPLHVSSAIADSDSDLPAGYSLLQIVLMKTVVYGVSFANLTWEYALDFISQGGTLWQSPAGADQGVGININKKDFVAILGGSDQAAGINTGGATKQVFLDAVCMYSTPTTGDNPMTPTVQTDDANFKFLFPGDSREGCGSASWNIQRFCTTQSNNQACTIAKQATGQLIQQVLPVARWYVCDRVNPKAPFCVEHMADPTVDGQAFFSVLLNYVTSATQLINLVSTDSGYQDSKKFMDRAKKNGWAWAGSLYWDLSQVQNHMSNQGDISKYIPNITVPDQANKPEVLSEVSQFIDRAKVRLAQYQGSNTDTDVDTKSVFSSNDKIGEVGNQLIKGYDTTFFQEFQKVNTSKMPTDPILFLHNVGMSVLDGATSIFLFSPVVAGGITLATSAVPFVALGIGVKAGLDWIKPWLYSLATLFLIVGLALAIYVPIYPFMIFLFGIIGWIIAIIEAMVAAPLICLGLTHPDGHDFLGKGEQALMLLLGVFLRPVLMIIGLLGGMILSYVALRLTIHTFADFMQDLFVSPQAHSNSSNLLSFSWAAASGMTSGNRFSTILLACVILVIFTGLVYVITTRCFMLIYVLPDNILRWIGMQPHTSEAREMAHQVQQIGASAARGASDGFHHAARDSGGTLEKAAAEALKGKEKKKKRMDVSGRGTGDGGVG